MSNIYIMVNQLSSLISSGKLSADQNQFLASIINGEKGVGENADAVRWSKLLNLTAAHEILDLNRAISAEIQAESRKSHPISIYIDTLKKVSSEISAVMSNALINKTSLSKSDSKIKKVSETNEKLDIIFQKTVDTYHGTIMLPVAQHLESKLGLSQGECFGYVAEWANGLLHGKKAFGVRADSNPPFKPIKFDSYLGKKYPELNHLAVLTENIATYQSLQGRFKAGDFAKALSAKHEHHDISYKDDPRRSVFYQSVNNIADALLKKTDEASETIYNLNIFSYRGGHALGFCKIKEKCHFFDSNSGWFRFENAEDFKRWLLFYFKTKGYEQVFGEYGINDFSLIAKNSNDVKSQEPTWLFIMIVLKNILMLPIALIYAACKVVLVLLNEFVIRGFRYAARGLNQAIKGYFYSELSEETRSETMPEQTMTIDLPKSVKHLDLAITAHKKAVSRSSHVTMAATLDIPLRDINEVQSRAARNEDIPKFKNKKPNRQNSEPVNSHENTGKKGSPGC